MNCVEMTGFFGFLQRVFFQRLLNIPYDVENTCTRKALHGIKILKATKIRK